MIVLSVLLFVPLLGALLIGLLSKEREGPIKILAIVAALVPLLISLFLYV